MASLSKMYYNFSMSMSFEGVLLTVALGLVTHLVFKKFEPTDLSRLTLLLGVVPAIPTAVLRVQLKSTVLALLISYPLYYSVLLLSIIIYRLSPAHPLYKHRGPFLCKISKLWLVYVSSRGKLHLYFKQLHATYGPIVRVGPNELSIVDVTLLSSVLGADGMPKGPLWEGRRISNKERAGTKNASSRGNLIGARDMKSHADARRDWNRAFTTSSVKGYEPIVIRRASQLVDELKKMSATGEKEVQVDMAQWLSFFAFDFMGDVVFGGGFELMRDGDKDGFWHTLETGLYLPALTQHVPWCINLITTLPFVGKETKALGAFAFKQVTRRMKEGSVQDDLFYHLLDEARVDRGPPPFPVLVTSAVTAIIAGSDTTATVLSNVFYSVLTHPSSYARLKAEVDAMFPPGKVEPVDAAKLAKMEYLNAVINESMRIHPPLSTSLQRAPTPGSGGHLIGSSLFIPEGTAVYVPAYVLHRDPRYFSPDPDKFWPERWLAPKDANVVINHSAFIPFSSGPANCVGKPLALLELRMVIAYIVQTFDMRLAEGYDKGQWTEDLKDFFVLQKGALPIVLTPR